MTLKLLLAEDDNELKEALEEALSLEDFDVTAFDNAEDALEEALKQPFDVALFDVVMPGLSGIDALASLRRIHPNIGIVISTAFATVDIAVEAMKKGADEFVTKPFNLATISVTLKRVHAERSPKGRLLERNDDLIFSALSNPIRRSVIKQLRLHRKMKFMDLCRIVGIEDHTKFNFHLRQLVNAGLVEKGDNRVYSLTDTGLRVHSGLLQ